MTEQEAIALLERIDAEAGTPVADRAAWGTDDVEVCGYGPTYLESRESVRGGNRRSARSHVSRVAYLERLIAQAGATIERLTSALEESRR